MNQTGGSRTDVLIKLVLLFFTSLLSFSVGTFVGKQFSDKKQNLVERYEPAFTEGEDVRGVANVDEVSVDEATPKEDVLTEEDIAALADELSKSQPKQEEAPKDVAKNEIKKAKPLMDQVAQRVAGGKEPVATKKKSDSRAPANFPSVVAASTIGKYTVQIASYKSESEAMAHAEKLKNQGFGAFYIPAKVKNNTWYRVSVGVYPDRATANSQRSKIQKQANIRSAIVQKIIR